MNSWTSWFSGSAYGETSHDKPHFERDRFAPLCTIHETTEAYDIESEITRSARADVAVKPHHRYVEISCGSVLEHEASDDGDGTRAPQFGPFVTRLPLSHPIDVAHTSASFSGGVLRIHAPKQVS